MKIENNQVKRFRLALSRIGGYRKKLRLRNQKEILMKIF